MTSKMRVTNDVLGLIVTEGLPGGFLTVPLQQRQLITSRKYAKNAGRM